MKRFWSLVPTLGDEVRGRGSICRTHRKYVRSADEIGSPIYRGCRIAEIEHAHRLCVRGSAALPREESQAGDTCAQNRAAVGDKQRNCDVHAAARKREVNHIAITPDCKTLGVHPDPHEHKRIPHCLASSRDYARDP